MIDNQLVNWTPWAGPLRLRRHPARYGPPIAQPPWAAFVARLRPGRLPLPSRQLSVWKLPRAVWAQSDISEGRSYSSLPRERSFSNPCSARITGQQWIPDEANLLGFSKRAI